MNKKYYAGIDLASKTSVVCVIDELGEVISTEEFRTSEGDLEYFFENNHCTKCVIEASPLAESIVSRLSPVSDCEFIIVDPRDAKKVIKRGKKTDKLDALGLANLCRSDWYVSVHKKSSSARLLKSLFSSRSQLQKVTNAISSSIRGLLKANGINDHFGSGVSFVGNVYEYVNKEKKLKPIFYPLLKVLDETNKQLEKNKQELVKLSKEIEDCKLLMTHPGVGPIVALSFLATIDDPHRFSDGYKVSSYLGLTPSVYQSGEVEYRGRITKDGDSYMRWLLVEAAHVILYRCKKEYPIKVWGDRLAKEKSFSKAKVAVARKISVTLHSMWVKQKEYSYVEAKN